MANLRVKKLREQLKKQKVDALIVEEPKNLYYLTGLDLSTGKLIVADQEVILLVDGRFIEKASKEGNIPAFLIKENILDEIFQQKLPNVQKLGFCSETTTYKQYLDLKKEMDKLQRTLVALDSPLQELRMVKDEWEITLMRQAALLGSQGFQHVRNLLKEGITESEVAVELEIFWKRHGADGVAFPPIIAFGPNTSMPHHHSVQQKLEPGHTVLIDIGVTVHGYHSDMTRTFFFGEPDPQMMNIFNLVQEAQEAALAICKPGVTVGELDAAARNLIQEKGHGEHFMHSLGHGIGLEVHEKPILRNKPPFQSVKLEPGMVITVEPGIYLPGVGGVRIEDTVVINEKGHENLTRESLGKERERL